MHPSAQSLARLASLACALAAPPGFADSLASSASSASSAGSASLGSLSNSVGGSSDTSSPRRTQVTAGDYRIVDVAEADARPSVLRLRLQPLDAGGGRRTATALRLDVPRATVAQHGLAAGDVVTARERPYGWEFARAAGDAFFLVLTDDWLHELAPRAVVL